MREILFRGKGNTKYNDGDWYEGYLIKDSDGDYQIFSDEYFYTVVSSLVKGVHMTEKELNQLHYLNIEISHLKQEIQKLENKSDVKAQVLTGMPSGNKLSDPTGDKGTELSENKMLLNLALARAEIEKNKLERFIAGIEDSEMRIIIRLRHINSLTWEEIGEELYMHRTTVKRKYFKFLKTEVARNAH